MKRDPRLHDLSRDHHHALVLARRASQGSASSDEDAKAMWREIATAFSVDLEPHFDVEERYLLVPLDDAGATELTQRTRTEHARLRELVAAEGNPGARLREFAELLRDHVRFEEGELFPEAEQTLSAEQLATVADASAAIASAQRRKK